MREKRAAAARRPPPAPPKPANVIDFFREPLNSTSICLAANHLNLVSSQCMLPSSQTTPSTRRRKWRPKEAVRRRRAARVKSCLRRDKHSVITLFGGVYNLLSPRQTSPYLITKARAPRRAVVRRALSFAWRDKGLL
ncbi:hypothetical protein EVAR_97498_1 [Eumeta japonica]|uniref:Uncharacterized protein n=1 Tax=Eumeta variegata TaxID=151549 RepID=A0A4C1WKR4_EUMVA|nr:hypothetical protein EVAR_97498_1 [Eumeta japonica]